jgi:hypothetical protein
VLRVIEAGELRPLTVGETLDAAVKRYRDHFRDLIVASAFVLVPITVINFLILISVPAESDGDAVSFSFGFGLTGAGAAAASAAALLVFVVALVAGALAQAACLRIVFEAYLGHRVGWRDSLAFAVRKLHSVVWVTVLFTIGTMLGWLMCLAPGVWLYGAWAVAIPALLVEDVRGSKALGRSFQLVRRRWWPVAGVLVVSYLLTLVVTTVFSLVLVPVLLSDASDTATEAANAVASGAATLLTTPFSAAVAAALYVDLRVRKEGFDIALVAQRLALAPSGPATPEPPTPDVAAAPPWRSTGPPAAPPWREPPEPDR